MAHFAELDENNTVIRVVVVGNDVNTSAGLLGENDMHVDGETWCSKFFKTETNTWKQTSYNNNFRKQYAGIGYTYDPAKNIFISPKPHASWALDSNDDWQAPITYPTDTSEKIISWDEDNLRWIASDKSNSTNNFSWDATALTWDNI